MAGKWGCLARRAQGGSGINSALLLTGRRRRASLRLREENGKSDRRREWRGVMDAGFKGRYFEAYIREEGSLQRRGRVCVASFSAPFGKKDPFGNNTGQFRLKFFAKKYFIYVAHIQHIDDTAEISLSVIPPAIF
ncbi:MAG TPA: hypothetical protein VN685_03970 [Rhizomicrobium sp.]|nr:hypothetical protein [Rhizomicrobium sp.]